LQSLQADIEFGALSLSAFKIDAAVMLFKALFSKA